MRFLSWNCQGLGSDLTRRNLKILCKKQNPQILFLMKTRQPENVILSWRRNLKFVDHVVVNPVNTGGGLALFWNNEVRVTVEDSSPNFVDTTVCFLSDGFVCKISWFYGSPHINEKNAFWRSMYDRFPLQSAPWLCLGDFNDILWPMEKWGGAIPDQWRMNLFHHFVSSAHLRDLHFQGPEFTWFAMQHGRFTSKKGLTEQWETWPGALHRAELKCFISLRLVLIIDQS